MPRIIIILQLNPWPRIKDIAEITAYCEQNQLELERRSILRSGAGLSFAEGPVFFCLYMCNAGGWSVALLFLDMGV